MFSEDQLEFFAINGYFIGRSFESLDQCATIRNELQVALDKDNLNITRTIDIGMLHNCFLHGNGMREQLSSKRLREATDVLLCTNAIIYAYQSSSLPPGKGNYGSRIHVDTPRFIPGYRTNLGYILALDAFNKENGATWVLPGSHLSKSTPSHDDFERGALQLICNRGDAIFFDARLWHRAGENHTHEWRHSITINFCRPYMRSRFDFPKMLTKDEWIMDLDDSARKFLGFDVRMPSSLEEFHLPASKRLYLPNQE